MHLKALDEIDDLSMRCVIVLLLSSLFELSCVQIESLVSKPSRLQQILCP